MKYSRILLLLLLSACTPVPMRPFVPVFPQPQGFNNDIKEGPYYPSHVDKIQYKEREVDTIKIVSMKFYRSRKPEEEFDSTKLQAISRKKIKIDPSLYSSLSYPREAIRSAIEGEVKVVFRFNTKGQIKKYRTLNSSHPMFVDQLQSDVGKKAFFTFASKSKNSKEEVWVVMKVVWKLKPI